MSDQCRHCTLRGDYDRCISENCFAHENWIAQQRISRIATLESELAAANQMIADLLKDKERSVLTLLSSPRE